MSHKTSETNVKKIRKFILYFGNYLHTDGINRQEKAAEDFTPAPQGRQACGHEPRQHVIISDRYKSYGDRSVNRKRRYCRIKNSVHLRILGP